MNICGNAGCPPFLSLVGTLDSIRHSAPMPVIPLVQRLQVLSHSHALRLPGLSDYRRFIYIMLVSGGVSQLHLPALVLFCAKVYCELAAAKFDAGLDATKCLGKVGTTRPKDPRRSAEVGYYPSPKQSLLGPEIYKISFPSSGHSFSVDFKWKQLRAVR